MSVQIVGVFLDVLGKPNAPLPVMMPERLAATPANQRIAEPVGSGPFRFVKSEWRPGNAMVLERNPDFREEYYSAELPPDEAAANVAYLKTMMSQAGTFKKNKKQA